MQPRVLPFFHAGTSTWSYVVADDDTGAAAIVDPVLDFDAASGRTGTTSAQQLVDAIREHRYDVRWLLETHAHADHLSAAQWLKTQFPNAPLAIGEGIRRVQEAFRPVYNLGDDFRADGSQFDHLFVDGERFALGNIQARVIAVPGHTSDSNAYLIGDALFTGDSLFMPDGGTARCDFPGGDAATLYRSINKVLSLPPDTRLYLCHDYQPNGRPVRFISTVAEQRQKNIHVRDGISEEEFVAMRRQRDATLDMPVLILPSVQVNMRAGNLPEPESNGRRYLKIPIDAL
jgi:glyoxylase-like metal-dependent hydrolase (beta-lactamase superfamily II)